VTAARPLSRHQALRRVVLTVLWLVFADRLVDPVLASLEHARYEQGLVFRFENSDLFGLGPLVEYLRGHPERDQPRTLFFGNSIVWGYGLTAEDAVPARLQDLEPGTKVFNVAINGFDMGSSYLISRAVIDSIDRLYVLRSGEAADPLLPSLIPVDADDLRAFKLGPPDRAEQALERSLGWWHLYRSSYRLQAALFGSSTRQYLYVHKGELVRKVVASVRAQAGPASAITPQTTAIELDRPLAGERPAPDSRSLEAKYPLMWRFGQLVRDHGKRAVFLHIDGYSNAMATADIAAFNRVFGPNVEIVVLRIPRSLTFDGVHLTAAGSRALAVLLRRERTGNTAGQ
jgi:hypothetical protein